MSSEATEPQGTDDETGDSEGGVDEETDDERVEARAQDAERVDSTSEDGDEESDQPSVPAPSDSTGDSAAPTDDDIEEADEGELGEESSVETLAEDSSDTELEESSEAEATDEEPDEEQEESEVQEAESRYKDLDEQAEEWLADLFERMNFDAEGELHWEDGRPLVDIGGPDADRLLGRGKLGPKAIEGIETLLQSVFSQDDDAGDIYVDVDGKRADRKEMLQEVADSMADKAVELGEMLTVSGLNSTERRIIHRKLRDYDGVDTESVGDGIFRRLTIDPS